MIKGFNIVERIPVQWGDMDAFGHVNNAKFFTWFETARIAYFRAIGFSADRVDGIGPILAHTACDFVRPVEYPADVLVGARTTRLGTTSFRQKHLIVTADRPEEPIATGESIVVMFDYQTEAAVPLPDGLRAAIAALDGVG